MGSRKYVNTVDSNTNPLLLASEVCCSHLYQTSLLSASVKLSVGSTVPTLTSLYPHLSITTPHPHPSPQVISKQTVPS